MTRFWVATVALLLAAVNVTSASPADEAFARLAAGYIDSLPEISPVHATSVGDHRADDRLDQVNDAARTRKARQYRELRKALDDIEWPDLSRANKVDARLLRAELDWNLWALQTLREWSWNPLHYVDLAGSALYALMARDFAPLPERLDDAASRMEQLPRFLRQARASLEAAQVPRVHAETAVQQNRGIHSIIDTMILPHSRSAGLPAELAGRLESAIETAREAIDEHQVWLEEGLLPRAAGDFRLGPALFDQKLRHTLNSPLGRRDIRMRAESEYVAVRARMFEIAKEVYADMHPYASFPDNPDEAYKQVIIRAALEQAYRHLPEADAIVEIATGYVRQASDFVRTNDLVTMPDDPLEIIVMPEYQRGVAVAYLDPPGPLDAGQKSFYAVAPLPEGWTEDQVLSFLREYNLYSLQNLTLHEAVPGHYLQLAHSNRYPSSLRAVLWSGPFVEGWGVYAERFMIEAGYLDHDPLMRLVNLKWYLRTVTNAIIDQAIHVDGMARDAAMKLMIEGGFQEEREAAGKWTRAQLTSTQLSTYFVGFQEHADMRRAVEDSWGEDFTLRRYHDAVLSYGSPPVRFVRALILDQDVPQGD